MNIFNQNNIPEKIQLENYLNKKISKTDYINLINEINTLSTNISNNPNILKKNINYFDEIRDTPKKKIPKDDDNEDDDNEDDDDEDDDIDDDDEDDDDDIDDDDIDDDDDEDDDIDDDDDKDGVDLTTFDQLHTRDIPTIIDDYISKSMMDVKKKPRFFKNKVDEKNIYTNFTDNSDGITISNRDETSLDSFTQKKNFYDLLTKYFSSEVIYTNDAQDNIFLFQYLVNNFFNYYIKDYITRNRYPENSIYFMYKGGTVIHILYTKYSKLFNHPEFLIKNKDLFNRSDADYQIFINTEIFTEVGQYNKIFYDMNKLAYNILQKIKNILNDSQIGDLLLPLSKINSTNLTEKLKNINKTLKENNFTFFADIDKFIGIQINDVNYMSEPIPDDFKIHTLNFGQDAKNDTDSNNKKNEYFLQNKKVPTTRKDFFVGSDSTDLTDSSIIVKNIKNKNSTNGIYNYFNQTNRFAKTEYLADFSLHRIKINCILYYKTIGNKDDVKYGFINCPSELIDVSISKFDDHKIKKKISPYIKTYSHASKTYKKSLEFNSYNLMGFIDDILLVINEYKFPWEVPKYEKYIKRSTILILLYAHNKYFRELYNRSDDNTQAKSTNRRPVGIQPRTLGTPPDKSHVKPLVNIYSIIDKIKSINDGSYTTELEYDIDADAEDDTINKYLNFLIKINKTVSKDDSDNSAKYKNMKKLIQEILDNFQTYIMTSGKILINPETIENTINSNKENVDYLTKYLKYKKKYLNLQNRNI